jgi:two-component system response regulator YesN
MIDVARTSTYTFAVTLTDVFVRLPVSRRFFLAFLPLFVLVLIGGNLVLFRIFVPAFERETEQLNELVLRTTQVSLDEQVFRRIESEYVDLTLNRAGDDYFYPLVVDPSSNLWRPVDSIAALRERVGFSDLPIHAISIFFPRWRYVISSQGFKLLDRSTGILEFTWIDQIPSDMNRRWVVTESVVNYNARPYERQQMLALIAAYPPAADPEDERAFVVIEVPLTAVRDVVDRYAQYADGDFWISDDAGEIVYANRPLDDLPLVGVNYVQTNMDSELRGLTYSFALPRSVLFQRSRQIRDRLYLVLVVTTFLALAVALVIARWIARPIARMASTARDVADRLHFAPDEESPNDLGRIERTIENLARRVETNLPRVRERFFSDVLSGRLSSEEIAAQAATLGIEQHHNFVHVAVIETVDPDSAMDEFPIDLVVSRARDRHNVEVLHATHPDGGRIVVIAGGEHADDLPDYCTDLLDRFQEGERPGPSGEVVAVGRAVADFASLKMSYEVALRLLDLHFLTGNTVLLEADVDVSEIGTDEALTLVPSETEICEIVSSEESTAIVELLQSFRDSIRENILPIEVVREAVHELSGRLLRCLGPTAAERAPVLDCDFAHFRTIGALLGSWSRELQAFYSRRQSVRVDTGARLVAEVVEFVNANFGSDISLSDLAERHRVSYSHLSKLFHEHAGVTFRDYLLQVRLERASELLRSTNAPVKAVAHDAGFNDAGYFIRQFKRKFGATPTSYRSIPVEGRGGST